MWDVIAFATAEIAGKEARRKRLAGIDTTIDKSKFNRTGYPCDKESRRDTQFKFFGYKPKRFISVYARKPRVRIKVKEEPRITIDLDKWRRESVEYNLHQGIQRNGLGYIRSSQFASQRAASAQMDAYNQLLSRGIIQPGGIYGGGLGSAGGIGLGQALTGVV